MDRSRSGKRSYLAETGAGSERRAPCWLAAGLVAAVLLASLPAAGAQWPLVLTQEPMTEPSTEAGRCAGCRVVLVDTDGTVTNLTEQFESACDPAVAYDGRTLLFAGKRSAGDRWNIYELDLASEGLPATQLTRDLGDCTEPLYLARASVTPPVFEDRVRWITFVSSAAGELRGDGSPVTSLYVMSRTPVEGRGTVLWRTTYNLGGDWSPTVMADGRILFASRQWSDPERGGGGGATTALLTITWAGDNINPFYGTYGSPVPDASQPCELIDERSVVFIEPDAAAADGGGRLVRLSLRRPLHSRTVIDGFGRYRRPHPWPDGGVLVAHSDGSASYGLVVVDEQSGATTAEVFDDPGWHDVDAQPVIPHPEPIARIPMLEFASVLDIPGFKGAGQLHCMNVYDSDRPELAELEPGAVAWARFVQGVALGPEPAGDEAQWPPPGIETRVLGEAPVEADGSFFVNAPGNVPWYIELLDADRRVVSTMHAWAWVRSGSQRGCVGCHADPELAPQNRATEALVKGQPTALTASARGNDVAMMAAHESAAIRPGGH